MSGQTFPAGNRVTGTQLTNIVYQNEDGVSAIAVTSGTDATTSATYVNMAGTGATTSFSFTKELTSTRLIVRLEAGWEAATAGTQMRFGVLVSGTDYDCCQSLGNATTTISHAAGFAIISGLAAGAYTIQGRWKRSAGTGTPTRSVNEWLAISCAEIT